MDDGLTILDISDPTNPTHVGAVSTSTCAACELHGAYDVKVSGNYAYVASNIDDALEILDISDPTNPVHVGAINDTGAPIEIELNGALSVAISGYYAYVASVNDDGVRSC